MTINTGSKKLFSDKELIDIDKLWNVGKIVNKNTFNDRYYQSSSVSNKHSKNIIDKLVNWFNSLDIEKIKNNPSDLILHRFNVGSYFSKHTDNQLRNGSLRRYLVGITINKDYIGGEFNTYSPEKLRIGKVPGVPYAIDSRVLHEITPVIQGIRKTAFIFIFDKHLHKKTII